MSAIPKKLTLVKSLCEKWGITSVEMSELLGLSRRSTLNLCCGYYPTCERIRTRLGAITAEEIQAAKNRRDDRRMAQKSTGIDLSGQRFGKLTVISRCSVSRDGQWMWMCKCDCGNEVILCSRGVRKGRRSCGCTAGSLWRLRSPENKVYEFRNLRRFIKEHPDLFDPEDVIWYPLPVRGEKCRAFGGITSISHRSKRANGSWKVWTICSQVERLENDGRDLLERSLSTPEDTHEQG